MSAQPPNLNQGRWRWNGSEWGPADGPATAAPTGNADRLGLPPKGLLAAGAAVVLLIVALTGVAIAVRASTKPPAAARQSATQLVVLAAEEVRTTDSYHMTGTSPDDGTRFAVSQQDATTVEIDDTVGDLSASLVETDGRTYVNGNAAFFQKYSPGLTAVAGRWLIFPPDLTAGPLTSVDTFRGNLVCALSKPLPWRLAADANVDGQPVHHVYVAQNGDRVDLYIASEGIPYLIRIKIAVTSQAVTVSDRTSSTVVQSVCTGGVGANRPGTDAHWQIDFDHWGDSVRVGVPSEPIPLVRRPAQS